MAAPPSSPAPVKLLASADAHTGWLLSAPDALHVLMLFAAWDAPSQPGGAMDAVLATLAGVHPAVHFAKVSARARRRRPLRARRPPPYLTRARARTRARADRR